MNKLIENQIPYQMKKPSTALYLSQSYQDAWEDYVRSINSPSFPVWDFVILTASNEHQARSFQAQIESRKGLLVNGKSPAPA